MNGQSMIPRRLRQAAGDGVHGWVPSEHLGLSMHALEKGQSNKPDQFVVYFVCSFEFLR